MSVVDKLLNRETGPAELPVSLAEAKAHLYVDHDEDDTYISSLLDVALSVVDGPLGALGKCLVTQTWTYSVDRSALSNKFVLPVSPVISIAEITYYDLDNVLQTVNAASYSQYGNEDGAWIATAKGFSWPAAYDRPDAYNISIACGFGAAAAVPSNIKHAMLLMVGHWYEHREDVVVGVQVNQLPMGAQHLLALSRKGWVAA